MRDKKSLLLDAESISFSYNSSESELNIFQDENFQIKEDEVITIIGESGSGKSTLLKLLANLLKPTSGIINNFCSTKGSFVFQTPVLLDWLSVEENIIFPEKLSNNVDVEILESLLKDVELHWAKKKYPRELSGGMRSRVQLARSLYRKTNILFLDEAFSALDEKLRLQMNMLFKRLRKQYRVSAVIVSHLIEEAVFLADRIWEIRRKSPLEPAQICEITDGLDFSNESTSVLKTIEFTKQVLKIKENLLYS